MSLDQGLHDLILRIHRTASEGGAWIDVGAEVGERVGAYGVGAILHRTDRPGILPSSALAGYRDLPFDEILAEYGEHFHARNPQALFERARPDALYYLDGQESGFTPEEYPDFTRWERDRMGVRFHATAYCRPAPHVVYGFLFPGSDRTGPISGERLDLFFLLTGHLRQAVATAHRLGTLGADRAGTPRALELVLESLSHAALVLDGRGSVLFANAAMAALARERDGLRLSRLGLRCSHPEDQDAFRSLCASAVSLVGGREARGGGVTTVRRPSGRRPYVMAVEPLADGPSGPFRPGAAVLVTIKDVGHPLAVPEDLLRQVFGLTRAEARLASRLLELGSLERVAAASEATIATLRTQLKQVFAKTATGGQAELSALLARLVR